MNEFPRGWFFIECPNRQNHVLTVPNMSLQPTTRVELRPKSTTLYDHQLWCFHEGFLINKHSGCVLGVEKERKLNNQAIYQQKRLEETENRKRQQWLYRDCKLILADEYALNDLPVLKVMDNINEASDYKLIVP